MEKILEPKLSRSSNPVFSKQQIVSSIDKISVQISREYKNKDLVILIVFKGGLLFAAEIMRKLTIPFEYDVVIASSYKGTTPNRKYIDIRFSDTYDNCLERFKDKDVLIIDDIADRGTTLLLIKNNSCLEKARSVKTCVLIDRPHKRLSAIEVDFAGIKTEKDDFFVGFGMGYDEIYRDSRSIYIMKKEE